MAKLFATGNRESLGPSVGGEVQDAGADRRVDSLVTRGTDVHRGRAPGDSKYVLSRRQIVKPVIARVAHRNEPPAPEVIGAAQWTLGGFHDGAHVSAAHRPILSVGDLARDGPAPDQSKNYRRVGREPKLHRGRDVAGLGNLDTILAGGKTGSAEASFPIRLQIGRQRTDAGLPDFDLRGGKWIAGVVLNDLALDIIGASAGN